MSLYYTPPNTPVLRADLSSQQIKDSFGNLSAAFDLLPPPLGGGVPGFQGGQFTAPQITGATILASAMGSNISPCWGTVDYLVYKKNATATLGSGNRGFMQSVAGDLVLRDNAAIQFMWDSVGNAIPTDPATATLAAATAGFFYIPQAAGPSTGVPSKIYAGAVPLIWNSTAAKLGVYSAGAWKFSPAFV